jgi:hypothetical protein
MVLTAWNFIDFLGRKYLYFLWHERSWCYHGRRSTPNQFADNQHPALQLLGGFW